MEDQNTRRAEMADAIKALVDARAKMGKLVAEAHAEDRADTVDKAMRAHVAVADAIVAVRDAYASHGVRPA